MLRSLDQTLDYTVSTRDGAIGRLYDVYFDDRLWTVRYLVVTGIAEEGVARLVSPIAVEGVSDEARQLFLSQDREQILAAPDITQESPISVQAEQGYHDYFGWPYYWQGPYAWGTWAIPASTGPAPPPGVLVPPLADGEKEADVEPEPAREAAGAAADRGSEATHHLRSADETLGYHVQALDGEIGHIEDYLVDDRSWYLVEGVVDTSNWWFGKKVSVPSERFTRIDWEQRIVLVDETREQVKESREFDKASVPREV